MVGGVRHNQRRLHHYLLMVIGWPIVLGITVMLVLRWRDVDRVTLVALVALTPFVLPPLFVADVIAWFSRSVALRVAAAVVTVASLLTVAPFDAVVGCGPTPADDAITILTANILPGGGRPDAIADNIVRFDADVVILQEAGGPLIEALEEKPDLNPWSARTTELTDDRKGVVIWSKWPLSDIETDGIDGKSSARAVVDTPHGRLTIAGVHLVSPVRPRNLVEWHDQFDGLRRLSTAEPTILAGDFNATEDHRPFRQLLSEGWTDVHNDKGCGPDLTWPADRLPFPIMRIDHILVTDHFEVLSTERGDPAGSDHFPVISRVRFIDG